MQYKLSDFGVEFNKSQLENGVPVFGFYRKGMPVCVKVVFFAGARYDTVPGVAHFLEHMLVAGSEKFPTKDKLAEPLERVGGGLSGQTGMDAMRLNISVPQKEDLELGLDILNQMIWHSLFEEKTIETERGSILAEIGENEEDPYSILGDLYDKLVFNKIPLQNNILGNKETLSKIGKENLLDFKNKFLTAGRMTVLISGGATIQEYVPLLNQYLSEFPPENRLTLPKIAQIYREDNIKWEPFRNNKQTYAKIGFRTMAWNENDRDIAALDVAADILGVGRASRLIKELRYNKGLVYSIGSGHSNYLDCGSFKISTSFEHEKIDIVLESLLEELKKLEKDGIHKDELEFAKSAMTKSFFNSTQTSWSWIDIHWYEMSVNPERARLLTDFINELDSLTLEEINATIKKYINRDNFYLAIVGTDKAPKIEW